MSKLKDLSKFNYEYHDVGIKRCVNELAYPKKYSLIASRESAKPLTFGYEKWSDRSTRKQIDANTVEKTKMYLRRENTTEYWLEINYKRTQKPK